VAQREDCCLKMQLKVTVIMEETTFADFVKIPTRCSFVIEFIIPKFIEGSTCFEWHTTYHQEL
jgi:hypothetical protein